MLLCLIALASAATYEQVDARLDEVESLREHRVLKGLPAPSDADVRKAAGGTIVVGVSGNSAWATAVINVPIGQLWAGLNDETRHPGYTAVGYSELLAGRVCEPGRQVLQYLPIPVPFVDDRWWVTTISANPKLALESGNSVREMFWNGSVNPALVQTASGKKIIGKAAPIKSSSGGWLLVAVDQFSTYVEYFSYTDPGAGIPSSVSSKLAGQGVRDNVLAITKFSKEGSPVCTVF